VKRATKPLPKKELIIPDGWKQVGNVSTFFVDSKGNERQVKAWEVGRLQMAIYKWESQVYASDALSTAFKFPLIDAKLVEVEGKVCIETPLDGTLYDIENGNVVKWVPSSGVNPVRAILGMLKEKEQPLPLKMYPVQVTEGEILVKVR